MSTTENCRFCWMCRQVCPVGHVTARETLTPHAWALTIESVLRGQLTWNSETAAVMYACADCGLCRSHCVTDQPLPDAIVSARAEIVRAGLAPEMVAVLDRRLRAFANAYADRAPVATGKSGTVALFVGDGAYYESAATVDSAVRLLRAAGVDAVPICQGRSSALLANTLGLQETAQALARDVVREVAATGAHEVLVLAPADRWTFEYVYPTRLGVAWPTGVAVREMVDVVAAALSSGRLRLSHQTSTGVYAYHDPCHAPRLSGRQTSGRALAAAALGAGRELFWREGRAHPCGAIGGLEHTSPDIAGALARARFDDAAEDQVRTIVTEDPVCAAHLARHRAHGIDVVNLYALLDEHIRAD